MRTALVIFSLLLGQLAVAAANDDDRVFITPVEPNWQLNGDLYVGGAVPMGGDEDAGVAMGGTAKLRYESTGRKVLIFGELMGEGFNNGQQSTDIRFSQFYVNTGLMLGNRAVKWRTPVNINLSRDILANEQFTVRYAFSGLYVRMIDEKEGAGKLRQALDAVADFVIANVNYETVPYNPPCVDLDPTNCQASEAYPASGRTVLGLYAALRYEIEKRGWGSDLQLELLQDLSPSYTKVSATVVGYKKLPGEFGNLRPYLEIKGMFDHDGVDPTNDLQGSVRVLGGISGRFGL